MMISAGKFIACTSPRNSSATRSGVSISWSPVGEAHRAHTAGMKVAYFRVAIHFQSHEVPAYAYGSMPFGAISLLGRR